MENQSTNQVLNQNISNQPIPQPTLQPISQPTPQPISQPPTVNDVKKPKFVPYPVSDPSSRFKSPVAAASIPPGTNLKALAKSRRTFKVIIIGDAFVGKTCLSFRFCNGRFPESTESTIGVDFRERQLLIDDELIKIQLWDTAGQERYRQSIVAHYYRNVNAVVFVYDVTNPQSFNSLQFWIEQCKQNAIVTGKHVPHIIIGNKCDLESQHKVNIEDALKFADQNDMVLFETSALMDSEADHIESIFMTLVHKLRQSKPMHVQSDEERKTIEDKKILLKKDAEIEPENEGWCC
uniref:Ras-related protein Rab-33 n=1 Tax=Strongyloides stercoralis TaxID=6248 RepID=A0AAF5D113_STRER